MSILATITTRLIDKPKLNLGKIKSQLTFFSLGINSLFSPSPLLITILMLPLSVSANVLEQIGFSTLPGNRIQVYLVFSQDAPTPISFSTENPARISLDFPNVRLGLRERSKNIGVGVVQGTNAAETARRSRVVIRLVRMVPFDINTVGNRVLVAIDNMGPQTTSTQNNQSLISNQPSVNQQPSVSASSSTPPPIQISQDNFVQLPSLFLIHPLLLICVVKVMTLSLKFQRPDCLIASIDA